uniref:non-specific serine/threonine protein kinase n=1 Tax=Clastoptera arizonana TaxID=38151 RepID=A0A1B6D6E4_9HEMI
MREVLKIGMTDKNANCAPVVRSTSTPGYLELTSDQVSRLICQDPLEKHYEVEEQPFARGKYATVRRCKDRVTGRQCAAKFLKKRRFSSDLRNEILHEVAVLEACKGSSRIVELHKVFESDNEMVLLLELACGGELQMLLDRDEVPSERQVVRLMKQILDGLVYLHSINVAHLDIKPQNLVLTGEFPDCDVKLCDFGISRYLSQGADVREILGTPDYVAPEVLNYEPISLATDMWSVGVLIYVLLTGCSPFGGDTKQETFCNITQCRLDFPDDLFEDISEEAKDLMVKLMVKAPSKRLTATECLQHPWFLNESTDLHKTALTTTINNSKATKPRTPVPSKKTNPGN